MSIASHFRIATEHEPCQAVKLQREAQFSRFGAGAIGLHGEAPGFPPPGIPKQLASARPAAVFGRPRSRSGRKLSRHLTFASDNFAGPGLRTRLNTSGLQIRTRRAAEVDSHTAVCSKLDVRELCGERHADELLDVHVLHVCNTATGCIALIQSTRNHEALDNSHSAVPCIQAQSRDAPPSQCTLES